MATLWAIRKYDTTIRLSEINIISFKSIGIKTYILNIIMFIPLGFFLPSLWKKYENICITITTGTLFSFLIEIDDLVMNTFGAIIGFLPWQIIIRIF